jgi:hypothetical protein
VRRFRSADVLRHEKKSMLGRLRVKLAQANGTLRKILIAIEQKLSIIRQLGA